MIYAPADFAITEERQDARWIIARLAAPPMLW